MVILRCWLTHLCTIIASVYKLCLKEVQVLQSSRGNYNFGSCCLYWSILFFKGCIFSAFQKMCNDSESPSRKILQQVDNIRSYAVRPNSLRVQNPRWCIRVAKELIERQASNINNCYSSNLASMQVGEHELAVWLWLNFFEGVYVQSQLL